MADVDMQQSQARVSTENRPPSFIVN